MINLIKESKLNLLGDKLIDEIKNNKDFFSTIFVVVPSIKVEQWFKAYWLRKEDAVLMNVKFININSFFKDVIKSDQEYKIAKKDNIRDFIIQIITENKLGKKIPENNEEYVYNDDGSFNSIKLFDLATKLADLFSDYENDNIEIVGYQKELYDLVIEMCLSHNMITLKTLFDKRVSLDKKANKIHVFGFNKFTNLQQAILDEYSKSFDTQIYQLEVVDESDVPTTLIAAPSKVREIEQIHSIICEKLLEDGNAYSDFLVLAKDISEYESVITRVFNQDNHKFPSISHVIIEKNKENGDITSGLKVLYEILNKGFFTRLDFFDLVNNPTIQLARNLDPDLINDWMESIIELNVYRDRPYMDDWDYAKKRVLLSKLSDINRIGENVVTISSGEFIPYSNISLSDESILKFVRVVDDLKSWLINVGQISTINESSLFVIKNELDNWFSIKNEDDVETNPNYRPIKNLFFEWSNQFGYGIANDLIPYQTLLYAIMNASKATTITKGSYFTNGVTFTSYDPNSTLSAKYIFFLGLDSKALPSSKVKSEIDIRDYDINDLNEDRDNFFKQYLNADECFYISYVNRDLKSDETFYPSTFIIDLYQRYKNLTRNGDEAWEDALIKRIDIKVSIDENRPWSELFTRREHKNKEYYLGLLDSNKDSGEPKPFIDDHIYPKKISVSSMAKFLEEPLAYKAGVLFGDTDDLDEEIRKEYEPFDLDALSHSVLVSDIAGYMLINHTQITESEAEALKKRFILEHRLPDVCKESIDLVFNELIDEAIKIKETISRLTNDNYEIVTLDELTIKRGGSDFTIIYNRPFVRYIDPNDNIKYYFEIKQLQGDVEKREQIIANHEKLKELDLEKYAHKLLRLYVISLCDIASLNDDEEYQSSLMFDVETNIVYKIKPSEARELLNTIYGKMNDLTDNYFLYINMVFGHTRGNIIESYDDFMSYVFRKERNGWDYFKYAPLFDKNTQLGYERDTFTVVYNRHKEELISLLKFIDLSKPEEEEEKDESI